MNCVEVYKLLSAYHDGELAPDMHNAVAEHLEGCLECAAMLASFRQLSELSQQLMRPEPPDQWDEITEQLAAGSLAGPISTRPIDAVPRGSDGSAWPNRFRYSSSLAVAATVLIALGLSAYFGWPSSANRHDEHLVANFDVFLNQFEGNPQAAEQVLLASYDGEQVDFPTAAKLLGYQAAVARGLPPGYSVDSVYVLNMPCCKCPQVICRRKGNGRLAVFEHEVDQPIWFGNRPAIEARCCGKPTRIVAVEDDLLAATWRSNKRYLTVIGARDVEEVTQLVSFYEGGKQPL